MALSRMQRLLMGNLTAVCATMVCIVVLVPSGEAFAVPDVADWNLTPSKRSFTELQCRGVFDKVIFGELNSVCQECYILYKEPELHGLCRSNCFSTKYFQGCLQALLRTDEEDKYDSYIRKTDGRKRSSTNS